nr:hypothetical protein CFP56_02498 [Quercus suber]
MRNHQSGAQAGQLLRQKPGVGCATQHAGIQPEHVDERAASAGQHDGKGAGEWGSMLLGGGRETGVMVILALVERRWRAPVTCTLLVADPDPTEPLRDRGAARIVYKTSQPRWSHGHSGNRHVVDGECESVECIPAVLVRP